MQSTYKNSDISKLFQVLEIPLKLCFQLNINKFLSLLPLAMPVATRHLRIAKESIKIITKIIMNQLSIFLYIKTSLGSDHLRLSDNLALISSFVEIL